ncbi:hypothetical protein E4U41_003420 [Claviceps citrina]|nr:hypothetical protein E4U41_003420 [Claviceps citrina]
MRYEQAMFRGVVLAGMNLGNNVINAWWSVVFYGASMAPWFVRGMWAMIAVSVALILWTVGLSWMDGQNSKTRGAAAYHGDSKPEESRGVMATGRQS